jgi:hypothetical protein
LERRIGVGTLFSTDREWGNEKQKTPVEVLDRRGKSRFSGTLRGPTSRKRGGIQESVAELQLELLDEISARLTISKQSIELVKGVWSPLLEIPFRVSRFMTIRSLTRVILTCIQPDVRLYALPLQIHPLHTPWRYATPRSFVKQTWAECGPFLTIGWPQDTTALEEQCITDGQFLALCDSIFEDRKRVFAHHLQQFREGILASIFDSLDRVQHMFWRDRADIVDAWYIRLDDLVGTVKDYLATSGKGQARLFILSDHGFSSFDYRVHLNRWLVNKGYLRATQDGELASLRDVDWSLSQAYAVGLNSLYLNLAGREGQGSVQPELQEPLLSKVRQELLSWRGPDGRPVVRQAWCRDQVFHGSLAGYGPDLVIGYSPGYRASSETGLGKWEKASTELNLDHWGADHCVDVQAVPAVLFCNQGLNGFPHPSFRDLPPLTIGVQPEPGNWDPPPSLGDEDEELVEERLRGLGYL